MIIGHTFQSVCQQKNSNFLQKKRSTFFVFPSKMPFLNLMTLVKTGSFFICNVHNYFLDPVQTAQLIHPHQEGLQIPDQCLDTNY